MCGLYFLPTYCLAFVLILLFFLQVDILLLISSFLLWAIIYYSFGKVLFPWAFLENIVLLLLINGLCSLLSLIQYVIN